MFRDSKVPVRVDSDPAGAEIVYGERVVGTTPMTPEMERNDPTSLRVTKQGYEVHRGAVPKHLNAGWAVADVATCVIPVALCIPLLVDAISGAWMDVDDTYRARLEPLASGVLAPGATAAPPPTAPPSTAAPPSSGTPTTPPPGQYDL